ncbi:hypothetical protein [Streptomyces sp. NBC_00203]|uniref:hypothetical protein n=1 Tax=Streptomyces sp. NBC_00203 TaxID=2975680 RepID=UPI00324E298E
MLSMHLRLSDLQEPKWSPQGGRWINGESWIELANVSTLVMEVNDDQAPRVRVHVKECKRDEADFVALNMETGEVSLAAGEPFRVEWRLDSLRGLSHGTSLPLPR